MIKAIVLLYIKTVFHVEKLLKMKLKGLGRIQRFLKYNFVFSAYNSKFYYNHKIEGSYDYLLIDQSNEPETRKFLDRILPQLNHFVFSRFRGFYG